MGFLKGIGRQKFHGTAFPNPIFDEGAALEKERLRSEKENFVLNLPPERISMLCHSAKQWVSPAAIMDSFCQMVKKIEAHKKLKEGAQ